MQKEFVLEKIAPKYEKIFNEIKENAEKRYIRNIREPLNKSRDEHVKETNKRSLSLKFSIDKVENQK